MRERRGSPRYRCRLRCSVRRGSAREEGTLLDVSLSGLSLETGLALSQGDPVELEIEGRLPVKALAWHARRIRRGGETIQVVGMMLSEVGPEYERFVAGLASRAPAPPPRSPAAQAEPSTEEAAPRPAPPKRSPPPAPLPQRPVWWRLRVKRFDAPRTRIITLAATSREEATERALAEMGEGWEILDVKTTAEGAR